MLTSQSLIRIFSFIIYFIMLTQYFSSNSSSLLRTHDHEHDSLVDFNNKNHTETVNEKTVFFNNENKERILKDKRIVIDNKVYSLLETENDSSKSSNHQINLKSEHIELSLKDKLINIGIIVFLVIFAGIMSGLTVGYLSIDTLLLELKLLGDDEEEKVRAKKIYKILHDKHRLLVTLLVSNAAAMEALPLFLDKLVEEWLAIIISTSLVLFVGEVIPQAICTGKNQLKIAAFIAPLTQFLLWILCPINYPVGKFLDCLLGKHSKTRYLNTEIRHIINLHKLKEKKNSILRDRQSVELEEELVQENDLASETNMSLIEGFIHEDCGLTDEQADLMISAIEIKKKRVFDIMVPFDKYFKLDIHDEISQTTQISAIKKSNSHIYIYENNESNFKGFITTPDLLRINIGKTINHYPEKIISPITCHSNKSVLYLYRLFTQNKINIALINQSSTDSNHIGITSIYEIIKEIIDVQMTVNHDEIYNTPGNGSKKRKSRQKSILSLNNYLAHNYILNNEDVLMKIIEEKDNQKEKEKENEFYNEKEKGIN